MSARPEGKRNWKDAFEDGAVIRTAFFAMLLGTLSVLYLDWRELANADMPAFAAPVLPLMPDFDPATPMRPGLEVTTEHARLEAPLEAVLGQGGVLRLTGTIDAGAFQRVSAELEAFGEYVREVALDSPGGAVDDAMAIGALIREKGFATSVADGALCASSCPLVLAGGTERRVGPRAVIGVHQIFAAQTVPGVRPDSLRDAGLAMSDAQRTTALISRHLAAMGVDGGLWLHALETPPSGLYYLSSEEMLRFALATEIEHL